MTVEFDGLDWEGAGYFGPPQIDADAGFPSDMHTHPWVAFAVALRHAQRGDFSLIPRLLEVMDNSTEIVVIKQYGQLLADAAPSSTVDEIAHRSDTNPNEVFGELLYSFCDVVASRGLLSDIPLLVRALRRQRNFKDSADIELALSDMLDVETTAIADHHSLSNFDEYEALVERRRMELVDQLGGEQFSVYRGQISSVRTIAELGLEEARIGQFEEGTRRRFEASTGIDCSSFFSHGVVQPLRVAAVLEDFLAGQVHDYRPGQRYFFGHPIP